MTSEMLRVLCQEILNHDATGVLAENSALRALADSLTELPERQRLKVARGYVLDHAMKFVISNTRGVN